MTKQKLLFDQSPARDGCRTVRTGEDSHHSDDHDADKRMLLIDV
jgi:hypothetical protein